MEHDKITTTPVEFTGPEAAIMQLALESIIVDLNAGLEFKGSQELNAAGKKEAKEMLTNATSAHTKLTAIRAQEAVLNASLADIEVTEEDMKQFTKKTGEHE